MDEGDETMSTKKPAKKDKPKTKAQEPKRKSGKELTEDQLEHVAGGAGVDLPAVQYKNALKIDF
jgi:hypothetical protein